MADLLLRRTSSSSFHESSSTHKYAPNNFIHLLTLMSLSLAAFAFILQWLGGLLDPVTRFSSYGNEPWPGFSRPVMSSPASSGFEEILGESKKRQSFPYFRDWKVKFGSDDDEDLLPKLGLKNILYKSSSITFLLRLTLSFLLIMKAV
ncbi:unnamed protein product [Cuscuta epithymum]|uniref:Uncharacterized protein n=1 Tax=Cuscuta epithymum TaxID=186058 RepID=A0AAV0C9L2_9ASTE|nr:unnamed protein product [Cuscuta epithymum]